MTGLESTEPISSARGPKTEVSTFGSSPHMSPIMMLEYTPKIPHTPSLARPLYYLGLMNILVHGCTWNQGRQVSGEESAKVPCHGLGFRFQV